MADEKKKRRRRFGDRPDGYKLRTINPMNKFMPYIMPMRCDACNTYADMFDVSKTDRFCRQKVKEGKTSFGFLHIMIAAYLRAISQRPGINRFVSGQKIYARNDIQIVMTIKKTLSLDSPTPASRCASTPMIRWTRYMKNSTRWSVKFRTSPTTRPHLISSTRSFP